MNQRGFTLIELMIAMVIGTIVMAAALQAFFSSQSTSKTIDQKAAMAINARGSMYLIEDNIRLMGFNPENDMNPSAIVENARPGRLVFRRNHVDDPFDDDKDRQISIGLKAADDSNRDGFAVNGMSALVIDGQRASDDIAALRFAYAFDEDSDGAVEVSGSGNVLWAVDQDNDGYLDRLLDANDDGRINADDAAAAPVSMNPVAVSRIRAVKVWLLVRSKHPVDNPPENRVFYVGGRKYEPDGAHAHSLLSTSIRCRNMF